MLSISRIARPVTAAPVATVSVTATQGSVAVVTMLLGRSVTAARQSTTVSIPVRDVCRVIVSLHRRVHSVMILLDSADVSQELQVSDVNVVSLASGTIVHMDACLVDVTKSIRLGLGAIQTRVSVNVCRV